LSEKGRKKIKEAINSCKKGEVSKVYSDTKEMIKDLEY